MGAGPVRLDLDPQQASKKERERETLEAQVLHLCLEAAGLLASRYIGEDI